MRIRIPQIGRYRIRAMGFTNLGKTRGHDFKGFLPRDFNKIFTDFLYRMAKAIRVFRQRTHTHRFRAHITPAHRICFIPTGDRSLDWSTDRPSLRYRNEPHREYNLCRRFQRCSQPNSAPRVHPRVRKLLWDCPRDCPGLIRHVDRFLRSRKHLLNQRPKVFEWQSFVIRVKAVLVIFLTKFCATSPVRMIPESFAHIPIETEVMGRNSNPEKYRDARRSSDSVH